MCGIAGIHGHRPLRAGRALLAMTEALRHRGPDGRGHVILRPGRPHPGPATDLPEDLPGEVFFGHRRLSIIDLAGTAQPLCNEDGSVWTIFNGEIYNYRELRQLLAAKGHVLREKGDTEVLVHLWEEFGEAMPRHLNGMFALAIYDVRDDTLFLARDRFGEKPLYYWDGPELFAFASELHALPLLDAFPGDRLDDVAVAQYFSLGYIPHPRTVYAAAKALPPASTLIRRRGKVQVRSYWVPRVSGETGHCSLDELSALLNEAVTSRLVADVPVGCFLSGGLDSSLIAAVMAQLAPPHTFTIATGDPDGDESEVARRIAGHIGAVHHEFRVEPNFVAVSERLARHYGQPFADYSAVPTYYVSRETRRAVKVALSGDGGDELFAGYDRYANAPAARLCGRIPDWLRRVLATGASLAGDGDRGSHIADFLRSAGSPERKIDAPSSLFHPYWQRIAFQSGLYTVARATPGPLGSRFAAATGPDSLSRQLETDQAVYLPANILTKVDITSMSVSLETRAPFLDHRLAEWANRLPGSYKLAGRESKAPLRQLAQRFLPPSVPGLPKRGFTLPLAVWMRQDIRDWCQAAVFEGVEAWGPYLRPEAVARLWQEHQAGRADHSMRLWTVIAMGLWHRGRGVSQSGAGDVA